MTTLLRVAFFGARHPHIFPRVKLLRERENVEIVGFVEEDDDIARELGRRTGLTRLTSPVTGIDVAMVEGLDPQVPALADAAMGAGAKSILLEKPGARNPTEFYELAARLRAAGVAVEIGYELHYTDTMQWCREIVGSGVLGQITTSRFHGGCPVGAGAELWQSVPDDIGGLVFTEGSHVLETVYDLFGVADTISSSVRKLPLGAPVRPLVFKPDLFSDPVTDVDVAIGSLVHEDVGAALLEYPTQTVTVDFTAWEPTTWCAQWWIEVYGTNGSLVAVPEPGEVRLHLRDASGRFAAGETIMRSPRRGLTTAYGRQLDSVLDRARGRSPETECGLEHGTGVMRMLEAIYDSARTRTWTATARDTAAKGANTP